MFIRSAYNYDRVAASLRAVVVNALPSMTIQSGKDEADINVLVRRFGLAGIVTGIQRPPALEEFTDIFDFQSAMNLINQADRSFKAMSAETRSRFNNDPARFVAFCSDEKNLDEMRKMGLAVPKVVEPDKAPVI